MTTLAIIPARGGSKRIPRKNIRPFLGEPIICYPIRSAMECGCCDEVMVSTDDIEIAEVARRAGASVPFLRSAKTSDDFASTEDVLLEVIKEYGKRGCTFELGCCLYPGAALLSSQRLRDAKAQLVSDAALDGVITVLRFGHPIQRALKVSDGRLVMMEPNNFEKRTQDLEPAYHDAGQCYWFRIEAFLKSGSLWAGNVAPLFLSETEAQDIDNEEDWELAELKFRLRRPKQ